MRFSNTVKQLSGLLLRKFLPYKVDKLTLAGVNREERRRQAIEALEKVGLKEHAGHRPSELSGGQQQRVSIARAIITDPAIVLADEPTGNLDTRTGKEIIELLCRIFRENGTTFVISSHDPQMEQYTDRTVRFIDGKIEIKENETEKELQSAKKTKKRVIRTADLRSPDAADRSTNADPCG